MTLLKFFIDLGILSTEKEDDLIVLSWQPHVEGTNPDANQFKLGLNLDPYKYPNFVVLTRNLTVTPRDEKCEVKTII